MTPSSTDTVHPEAVPATTFGGQVARVVAELSAMLAGDGAGLDLRDLDDSRGLVELALRLDGADCEDCVLPPERLREVVRSRLRTVPGFSRLALHDPRVPEPAGPIPTAGRRIIVRDPTARTVGGDPDPGPDAGSLRGKRVGIRVDVLWAAWDQTVDEWARLLEGAGATVSTWRRAQGLKGADGELKQAEYDAFVGTADVIISGLANCGSCTSWSVKDGLTGLGRGLPTVVAVTEQFEQLAQTLAADDGRPGLRLVILPASLNTLPEEAVRAAARERYPALLAALGVTV